MATENLLIAIGCAGTELLSSSGLSGTNLRIRFVTTPKDVSTIESQLGSVVIGFLGIVGDLREAGSTKLVRTLLEALPRDSFQHASFYFPLEASSLNMRLDIAIEPRLGLRLFGFMGVPCTNSLCKSLGPIIRVHQDESVRHTLWQGSSHHAVFSCARHVSLESATRPSLLISESAIAVAMEVFDWLATDLANELAAHARRAYSLQAEDLVIPGGRVNAISSALSDLLTSADASSFSPSLTILPRFQEAVLRLRSTLENCYDHHSLAGLSVPATVELLLFGSSPSDRLAAARGELNTMAPWKRPDLTWWQEHAWWKGLYLLPSRKALRFGAVLLRSLLERSEVRHRLIAAFISFVATNSTGLRPVPIEGELFRARLAGEIEQLFPHQRKPDRLLLALPETAFNLANELELTGVSWLSGTNLEVVQTSENEAFVYSEYVLHVAAEDASSAAEKDLEEHNYSSEVEAECPACGSSPEKLTENPADPERTVAKECWSKTCPNCGRYNRRLWWQCCRHGKIPIDVSVADDRCPECILRHHRDPANFPLTSISLRPDLLRPVFCPHCARIHCRNARHPRFRIPREILPYYRNGVTASEREDFLKLAREQGLAEDCRCPSCRTLLIPIHHREGGTCEDTRAGGCAALPAPYHPSP